MSHSGPRRSAAAAGGDNHPASEVDSNDRANYSRVKKAIEYLDECMRSMVKSQWQLAAQAEWRDGKACGARLLQRLQRTQARLSPPDERKLREGILEKFDTSLLCLILDYAFKLPTKKSRAVGTVRRKRNELSHMAKSCMADADFFSSFEELGRAVDALGGDAGALQRIQSGPLEDDDIMLILSADPEAEEAATARKDEGNRFYRDKNYDAAAQSYTDALKYNAKLPPTLSAAIYANRSLVYRLLGKLHESLADAEEARKILPSWFRGHQRAAETMSELCKFVEAQSAYETAIQLFNSVEAAPSVVADMREKLQNVKVHAEKQQRNEHLNAAYLPGGQTSGPYREAFQSRSGISPELAAVENFTDFLASSSPDPVHARFFGGLKAVNAGRQAHLQGKNEEAVRFFTQAATQFSHPEGMYNLANMMFDGKGTPQNVPGAKMWAKKATEQPDVDIAFMDKFARLQGQGAAWNMLGNMAAYGHLQLRDEVEARQCYEKAAECYNMSGLNNLGLYHFEGKGGLPLDFDAARAHFLLSTEMGDNNAMANLGMLELRLGYLAAARLWYQTAIDHGLATAAETLECLPQPETCDSPNATPAQLSKQAAQWRGMLELGPVSSKGRFAERRQPIPSLEALRSMPQTPYMKQLVKAAELLLDAAAEFALAKAAKSESGVARALSKAGRALRIPDAYKAVDPGVYLPLVLEAKENPDTAEKALLASYALMTDSVSAALAQTVALAAKFPQDDHLMERHACLLLFDGPDMNVEKAVPLMRRALAAAEKGSAVWADRCYHLGVALTMTDTSPTPTAARFNDQEEARQHLERFLEAASAQGHRKAPNAYFQLVFMVDRRQKSKFSNVVARKQSLYTKGIEAKEKVPAFLRERDGYAKQRMAESMLRSMSELLRADDDDDDVTLYGGSALPCWPSDCPFTARSLSCDISCILRRIRQDLALLLSGEKGRVIKGSGDEKHTSIRGPKESRWRGPDESVFKDILVGEMHVPRQDRVFDGRVVTLMVVAAPAKLAALHMAVEDSRRDAIALGIYNLAPHQARLLVPGRLLRVRNPYLRLDSGTATCRIRVDYPDETMQLGELVPLCWACLKHVKTSDATELKMCAKCKQAKYCSAECQKLDWEQNGHKSWCWLTTEKRS